MKSKMLLLCFVFIIFNTFTVYSAESTSAPETENVNKDFLANSKQLISDIISFSTASDVNQQLTGIDNELTGDILRELENADLNSSLALFSKKINENLNYLFRNTGTAQEKQEKIQELVTETSQLVQGKFHDVSRLLAEFSESELRIMYNRNLKKFSKWIPDAVPEDTPLKALLFIRNLSQVEEENSNPLFKTLANTSSMLNEIVDLWGKDVFWALSSNSEERTLGIKNIVDDYLLFKSEAASLQTLLELYRDTNGFKVRMEPSELASLLNSIENLGTVFIKIGQVFSGSIIDDIDRQIKTIESTVNNPRYNFSQEKIEEFNNQLISLSESRKLAKKFQDGLTPISSEYAAQILDENIAMAKNEKEKEFLLKIKANIDFEKPFKSGTMASTFKVNIKESGGLTSFLNFGKQKESEYVIKIVRPDLQNSIKHQMKLLKTPSILASGVVKSSISWIPKLLTLVLNSLEQEMYDEANLSIEGRNLKVFNKFLSLSPVRIPKNYYSSKNLLVMESITDAVGLEEYIDRHITEKYEEFMKKLTDNLERHSGKELKTKNKILFAEYPEEYQSYKKFTKIFGDLVNSMAYMNVINQIHADLHPGNILISERNNVPETALIDFALTTDISGMITDPIFLLVNMKRNNVVGITKNLYSMKDNRSLVSQKEIYNIVKDVMDSNGRVKNNKNMKQIIEETINSIRNNRNKFIDDIDKFFDKLEQNANDKTWNDRLGPELLIAAQILKVLMDKTDYLPDPKAILFVKTGKPLLRTVSKIGSVIPTKEMLWIAGKNITSGSALGFAKTLFVKYPKKMNELDREFKIEVKNRNLNKETQFLRPTALMCERLYE